MLANILPVLGFLPIILSLTGANTIQDIAIGFGNDWFDDALDRTAAEGTFLSFHFSPSLRPALQHSLVQTTFDNPCLALPGGFSTGVTPLNGTDFDLKVVNASIAVYFACAQHCHDGEVGVINAPVEPLSTGSFDAFVQAAVYTNITDFTNATNPSPPGSGFGVIVVSHAEKALSHSGHTFPTWTIGIIFLAIMGAFMGTLYLCLRRYFNRRHCQWLARRRLIRGEESISDAIDPTSGSNKTGPDTAHKPPPFILDGFPI